MNTLHIPKKPKPKTEPHTSGVVSNGSLVSELTKAHPWLHYEFPAGIGLVTTGNVLSIEAGAGLSCWASTVSIDENWLQEQIEKVMQNYLGATATAQTQAMIQAEVQQLVGPGPQVGVFLNPDDKG